MVRNMPAHEWDGIELRMQSIDVKNLVEATKVLGQWASIQTRSVIELMALTVSRSAIEVHVGKIGKVTFTLDGFYLGNGGVSVLLVFEDEGTMTNYVFTLNFTDINFDEDDLGYTARINFMVSYDAETEEFSLMERIRLKLITAAA